MLISMKDRSTGHKSLMTFEKKQERRVIPIRCKWETTLHVREVDPSLPWQKHRVQDLRSLRRSSSKKTTEKSNAWDRVWSEVTRNRRFHWTSSYLLSRYVISWLDVRTDLSFFFLVNRTSVGDWHTTLCVYTDDKWKRQSSADNEGRSWEKSLETQWMEREALPENRASWAIADRIIAKAIVVMLGVVSKGGLLMSGSVSANSKSTSVSGSLQTWQVKNSVSRTVIKSIENGLHEQMDSYHHQNDPTTCRRILSAHQTRCDMSTSTALHGTRISLKRCHLKLPVSDTYTNHSPNSTNAHVYRTRRRNLRRRINNRNYATPLWNMDQRTKSVHDMYRHWNWEQLIFPARPFDDDRVAVVFMSRVHAYCVCDARSLLNLCRGRHVKWTHCARLLWDGESL